MNRKQVFQIAAVVCCLGGAVVAYIALSPKGAGPVQGGGPADTVQAPPPVDPNAALRPTTQRTEAETTEFMTQRRATTAPTKP